MARLDYASHGRLRLRVLDVGWTVEAEDVLIERTVAEDSNRTTVQLEYQGPLGDMTPVDNILLMRGSGDVTRRRGMRLEMAETLQLRRGGFGGGWREAATRGWGLRMRGVFKLAAAWTDAAALDLLAGHFDLQYFSATYLAGTDRAADFRSFSLPVKGFW